MPTADVLPRRDPVPETPNPGILDALRSATRSRHVELASSLPMARLFAPDYTVPEYRAHLGRLLGLFEPMEQAVADTAFSSHFDGLLQRSSELCEDLRAMGVTASEIGTLDRCPRLPFFAAPGLSGYFYVILGSMLGGKIIVKQLRVVLGDDAGYSFYGDEEGRHEAAWLAFCSGLEQNSPKDVKAICATAEAVFDTYAWWLSARLYDGEVVDAGS